MKQTHNNGFTLVETLIAILILSMSIGALMNLAAGGFFAVRYARNDIVATHLVQESLEYIRNTRDTAIQQGVLWDNWKVVYGDAQRETVCFDADGCNVSTYVVDGDTAVSPCSGTCDNLLYFEQNGLYGYESSVFAQPNPITTTFVRTVTMQDTDGGNQVVVTTRVDWKNGTVDKHTTQSIILTKYE